ncbi:MAG: divalent-cation tolerance protein CutA [Planctomycetales bacterium]|nr:divalent-cation tolerance protein CutA [Planctomycetales bacterium]
MNKIVEITTTVETVEAARELAEQMVVQHLAACVQITGPIESVYRWQGQLCKTSEYKCTMKTTLQCQDLAVEWMTREHPYQIPEILVQQCESSESYTRWLAQQLAPDIRP